MGVHHLGKHQQMARNLQNNTGAPDSTNFTAKSNYGTLPKQVMGGEPGMPKVNDVQRQSRAALKPRTQASRPASGGRMGAKSGNGKLGMTSPDNQMSGGRAY